MSLFIPQFLDYQLRADYRRRPLDWRFQRAVQLSRFVPRRRCPRVGDDDLTRRYADLLHRLHDQVTFEDMDRIRSKHPDLLDIHLAYALTNKTELALIDALLLSRAVDREMITAQSGLSESQQNDYRKLFLDVEDRRDMTIFIATQLMEPHRLRKTSKECHVASDVTSTVGTQNYVPDNGTLPYRAQCVLKVIGFYSSPIVLELVYTGFLSGTIPLGRDSAMRFLRQSTMTNVQRYGLFASDAVPQLPGGLSEVFMLAARLATEEKEENQIDTIQNMDVIFKQGRSKFGKVSMIYERENIPSEVYSDPYEFSALEIADISHTGVAPKLTLEHSTSAT